MEPCPHLRPPTPGALSTLRDPERWCCRVCHSTDGVWCCLTCGHVGCGRRAHMPALGGGHSRHHYQTMAAAVAAGSSSAAGTSPATSSAAGGAKPEGRTTRNSSGKSRSESEQGVDPTGGTAGGNHEVCIDILSRAVHCYACDDYVISDVPWLSALRSELEELETRSIASDASNSGTPVTDEGADVDVEMEDVEVKDDEGGSGPMVLVKTIATGTVAPLTQQSPACTVPGAAPSVINYAGAAMAGSIGPPPLTQQQQSRGLPPRIERLDDSPPPPRRSPRFSATTPPGCTGLRNLGNTCYMNSVLQSLSHCSGFRSFFRDFLRAAAPLRLGVDKDRKGPGGEDLPKVQLDRQTTARHLVKVQDDEKEPERLALTEAMHALLRVLWSGRWAAVSPRAFVHAVWTHGGLFAARRQQDASEFLGFVLDTLDDELSPLNKDNGANKTKDGKEKSHVGTGPGTVLTDLFGIDQRQEVTCDGCSTKTVRTEPLLGLVLSLPPREDARTKRHNKRSLSLGSIGGKSRKEKKEDGDDVITLQDCLAYLTASERLTGDNEFYCDKCQANRDATKTLMLSRRPQTLLLSFRRTMWTKSKGLHKDGRRVSFPLDLDATDLLGRTTADGGTSTDLGRDVSGGSWEDVDGGCHYRLAAIVSHSGTSPLCGHYIAWCRVTSWASVASVTDLMSGSGSAAAADIDDGGRWYLFNDSHVSPADEDEVLGAEAFILLYERRQVPADMMVLGG